jgi:excisionase family DNA binding protein
MATKNNPIVLEDIYRMLTRIEQKVDIANTKNSINKEFLTTAETCQYLGCSRVMIWKLVKSGKLNKQKLENGRTYYASAELKKLIETPFENAA